MRIVLRLDANPRAVQAAKAAPELDLSKKEGLGNVEESVMSKVRGARAFPWFVSLLSLLYYYCRGSGASPVSVPPCCGSCGPVRCGRVLGAACVPARLQRCFCLHYLTHG